MSNIKSIKFPIHQNKARVYDAAGKYLFWISLAGESNALDDLREKGESWLDFRNRTQPLRDALEAEELTIAEHFVDAINAFEGNATALAAKDAEIARLEDELYDAQHGPWPEWAEKILKVVRSYSGYDGYDDVTDGIDLVGEVEEALSEFYTEAERLRAKLKEVTGAAL